MHFDTVRKAADLVGADPDNLVLCSNVTSALNDVLKSIRLKPEDQILVNNFTYNAIANAAHSAVKKYDADTLSLDIKVARLPNNISICFASHNLGTLLFVREGADRVRVRDRGDVRGGGAAQPQHPRRRHRPHQQPVGHQGGNSIDIFPVCALFWPFFGSYLALILSWH